jgi:predicted nuclease of predicted toxin-antitoxin system
VIKLLADENFDNTVVRGLLRRNPNIDIVRVQDVGLSGADDPTILSSAAQENRVLLTHDVATITRYAYERVTQGQPMPGVIEVGVDVSIGKVIDDILIILECSLEGELEGQIQYLPL